MITDFSISLDLHYRSLRPAQFIFALDTCDNAKLGPQDAAQPFHVQLSALQHVAAGSPRSQPLASRGPERNSD